MRRLREQNIVSAERVFENKDTLQNTITSDDSEEDVLVRVARSPDAYPKPRGGRGSGGRGRGYRGGGRSRGGRTEGSASGNGGGGSNSTWVYLGVFFGIIVFAVVVVPLVLYCMSKTNTAA